MYKMKNRILLLLMFIGGVAFGQGVEPDAQLKTYFETFDKPTQSEFYKLIDSKLHVDSVFILKNVQLSNSDPTASTPTTPGILRNTTTGDVFTLKGGVWTNLTDAGGSTVTTSQLQPLTANEGDIWFDNTTTPTVLNIYDDVAGWIAQIDNDTQLTESEVDAFVSNNSYLTTEVDGDITNELATVTTQATAPTTPKDGDIWFDNSSTPTVMRIWDGTAWVDSPTGLDENTTVTDSDNIDFTQTLDDITGEVILDPATDNILTTSVDGLKATLDLKYSATFFVATSTADIRTKEIADYILTGTNDQDIINTAWSNRPVVDGVPSGNLLISEGVVNISAPIMLDFLSLGNFEGSGASTIIMNSAATPAMIVTKPTFNSRVNEEVIIKNLHFRSSFSGQNTGIEFNLLHNTKIEDCTFRGQQMTGMLVQDCNNVQITGNQFVDCYIGIDMISVQQDIEDIIISHNDISYPQFIGIRVNGENSATQSIPAQKINIINNTFEDDGEVGIYFKSIRNSIIANNQISQLDTSIILDASFTNKINDNGLKEGDVGVQLLNGSEANKIEDNQIAQTQAINVDATSSRNFLYDNGRGTINDLGSGNNIRTITSSGNGRYPNYIAPSQTRFFSETSSFGGGFSDIAYLFQRKTAGHLGVAFNVETGFEQRTYHNRNGQRGWVEHYMTNENYKFRYDGLDALELQTNGRIRFYEYGEGNFPLVSPLTLLGMSSNGEIGEVDISDYLNIGTTYSGEATAGQTIINVGTYTAATHFDFDLYVNGQRFDFGMTNSKITAFDPSGGTITVVPLLVGDHIIFKGK